MRDGKAMCLIPNPLDKEHPWRVFLLHDRVGAPLREDLLALLGQREGWYVRIARRLQDLERGAQLSLAAIDEDQVWPAGERAVADDVGLLATLRRLQSLEPAPQDLLQHREVVGSRHELDLEVAVVIVARTAILEHDHRPDG